MTTSTFSWLPEQPLESEKRVILVSPQPVSQIAESSQI